MTKHFNQSTVNGPRFVPPPSLDEARRVFGNPSATNARDTFVQRAAQPPAATVDTTQVETAPAGPTKADTAFASYLESLRPTSEQTGATNRLNALRTQSQLDQETALGRGETLGFARGEAGRVARQNAILLGGAAADVSAQESLASGRSDISKARFDFEQSKLTRERGGQFELSPGQVRFDRQGNEIARLAPRPVAPKVQKGITRSGGLVYTPQDAAEDSRALEGSRGPDGFVDPNLYQRLYNEWISQGGLQKDFLSKFPPKTNVNPANKFLPPFLMPKLSGDDETLAAIERLFGPGK